MSTAEMVLAVVGLVAISAFTRTFFFLSEEPWRLPTWLERGLKYAPLAALSAVVFPEVLLNHGAWPSDWRDARFFATAVAVVWAWWRRGMLGTILSGMAVLLALKLGLGW
ncbi:MAG: AzlD domain-containing protein [Rubrivivax sp.]|nr:MAG: AzlD domain-containing protein [Rubrivivax sp.]